jgi:hypothetical protein
MEVCVNPHPPTIWVKDEPELGQTCERFKARTFHRQSNSVMHRELTGKDLAREQNKMQDIIAKIIDKNSPKTSNLERKALLKSLKCVPLGKRKDFIN